MNPFKNLSDDQLWTILEDVEADRKSGKAVSDYATESYYGACRELRERGWC